VTEQDQTGVEPTTTETQDTSAAAETETGSKAPVESAPVEPAPVEPAVEVKLSPPAKVKGGFIWGTGRRKSSVARVRLRSGSGKIVINTKKFEEFFPTEQAQRSVTGPLRATETRDKYDIFVTVQGGGITGQAGATALGIGRALKGIEPSLEIALREGGFLTRDSRMKERKKYGLRGARRAFQFSKR